MSYAATQSPKVQTRAVSYLSAKSSAMQKQCSDIRNSWSCSEERRRRKLADVMQVRLLDAITA